jgi:PAS domain S-box-containing protein
VFEGPILVIDRDASSRQALTETLRGAALAHRAVCSCSEVGSQPPPSLILLDLDPPNSCDDVQVLRDCPHVRGVPILALASLDDESEVAKAFASGADDFLRKPFKPIELIARIRGQLRLRAVVDQLARKEKDALLVLELTQALASNLDFRSILFTVVQRIAEVVGVDRASIVLVQEEGDVGYVVAASDDPHQRDVPIDMANYPEIHEVIGSRVPLIVTDASPLPGTETFHALAILPILYEGRALGVLGLRARRAFTFGPHEIALCTTVTNAMAVALRNARVLQSLRDQTTRFSVARIEAERRVQALERYADFFESAADGIIVCDRRGRVLFSNPRARTITGYTEGDFRDGGVGTIVTPEDLPAARLLRDGFARGVFPQGVDLAITKGDGATAILSLNFNPLRREDGLVLCSFREVTEERATAQELLQTKKFLESVIDSSVDAIVSADVAGVIRTFNRAAERLFGWSSVEAVGRDMSTLYPEGVAQEIMAKTRAEGGRIDGLRTTIVDRGLTWIPASVSVALLFEPASSDSERPSSRRGSRPNVRGVGSVAIFTDLRERVRMEQRLQQAQEQLLVQERAAIVAELAGTAAHELNQPLTSVLGYAELLRRRLDPSSPSYAAVEVIVTEAERMAEIVRKIGKITKYETKVYVGQARILDLERSAPPSGILPDDAGSDPSKASS